MSNGGRKLRNLRANDAIRAFQRLGYSIIRVRGSHYVLKHEQKGLLVLPIHRGAIKTGIIMDALKKAKITVEEFEQHL